MLGKITLLVAVAVVVYCVPLEVSPAVTREPPVAIVSQESHGDAEGNYKWGYESADGTKQEQTGAVKAIDQKNVTETVQGSVEYKDDEGKPHSLTYTADETGYHPSGSDIPTPPPIPAEILQALEYIAAHPEENIQSENIH